MKKMILWSSCALLFVLTTACNKNNEIISLLSMHTWVVTSTSLGGGAGDEYKFYDNRLFMHYQGGALKNDNKWDFYNDNISSGNIIKVNSNTGPLYFEIKKITSTELELVPLVYVSLTLKPTPTMPNIQLTAK